MNIDKFGRYGISTSVSINPPGFTLTSEGDYDMNGKKVRNIGAAEQSTDAISKTYLETLALIKKSNVNNNFDAEHKNIVNVKDPVLANDAATANYVRLLTPPELNDHWKFKNKRISDLGDGIYDTDAANIRTVRREIEQIHKLRDEQLKRFGHEMLTTIYSPTPDQQSENTNAEEKENLVDWSYILEKK